jgi:hypothetical protein
MWKKLACITILLLHFNRPVYGEAPSARDIYKQLYLLYPGAVIKIAYEMLGSPQEKVGRIFIIPPNLHWILALDRRLIVYLRNDSIISFTYYLESYKQIETARERCKELKEGFCKMFGAPLGDFDDGIIWYVDDFAWVIVPPNGVNDTSVSVILKWQR